MGDALHAGFGRRSGVEEGGSRVTRLVPSRTVRMLWYPSECCWVRRGRYEARRDGREGEKVRERERYRNTEGHTENK